ncbi:Acetylxylan esterase precursor [Stieleria neptunia]|uniref:Acetylxylan esterase n=1 Tax=Stieleria neptunia TaxID=2527979 RepID=A0A518HIW8_9BACT|nr:alpha/beta hydrolase [Stieleria neptunia]QDV40788.1 Acetylxylan esterase precursor [Stieleria neptunia]
MKPACLIALIAASAFPSLPHVAAGDPIVMNVWPDKPPGETQTLPEEADQTKPVDRLIAGRRIIKLGNVSTPQIAVYQPPAEHRNGTAVVICPGGGHHILAYDLEGTEVAEWLNTLGVTAVVLKYRVPARDADRRWRAAVQDAQRAMSLVRSHAEAWKIDPDRIGICGFSAGGETAGLTAIFQEDRTYEAVDKIDQVSIRPDFALLIYAAGMVEKGTTQLHDYIKVNQDTPPMFFAHAFDDRVSVHNCLTLAGALKEAGVPAELHVYATGGHGYGLRVTDQPVTRWPEQAASWLKTMKLIP